MPGSPTRACTPRRAGVAASHVRALRSLRPGRALRGAPRRNRRCPCRAEVFRPPVRDCNQVAIFRRCSTLHVRRAEAHSRLPQPVMDRSGSRPSLKERWRLFLRDEPPCFLMARDSSTRADRVDRWPKVLNGPADFKVVAIVSRPCLRSRLPSRSSSRRAQAPGGRACSCSRRGPRLIGADLAPAALVPRHAKYSVTEKQSSGSAGASAAPSSATHQLRVIRWNPKVPGVGDSCSSARCRRRAQAHLSITFADVETPDRLWRSSAGSRRARRRATASGARAAP